MRVLLWLCAMLAGLAGGCRSAPPPTAVGQPATPPPQTQNPTPTEAAAEDPPLDLPGVYLNREAGYVELDAVVSPRTVAWLELLACAGRSLEHESLVTVQAQPSHVHLALVLLGLEPGKPQTWRQAAGELVLEPAEGAAVEVYFVLDGRDQPIPAHEWVVDQRTGEPLTGARWLFAGSKFVQISGRAVYAADVNGPVVTLVHFGDEVVAPATTRRTNRTDEQAWAASEAVPPTGTAVRLRLSRPAEP